MARDYQAGVLVNDIVIVYTVYLKTFMSSKHPFKIQSVQPRDIDWPTGYGKELSNCHACCLAQLCLAAA